MSKSADEGSVFVGNLDVNTDVAVLEPLLYEIFSQCGQVQAIRLPTSEHNRSKGFAFVDLGNPDSALYSTLAVNGLPLNGRYLRVATVVGDEPEKSVKLDNIAPSVSEIELYEALSSRVKGLRGVSIKRNDVGRSIGKATVWFSDRESQQQALAEIRGKDVYLEGSNITIGY